MVFNDTTNKAGLIQTVEFWTRLEDGAISGDATLLKQITARINSGFDSIMPLLLSYTDYIRWDDFNHTDRPIGTFNMVSGQSDYTIAEDDNSLDILNIMNVRAVQSSTGTEYRTLSRMLINDDRAVDAMSPNPSVSGAPTHFLEVGNTIFLYPEPNFSATNGIKIFFEREQSYFASTDTTKEPGIPKPFHELLALYAALDWNAVHRATDQGLMNEIRTRIAKKERELSDLISMRNPTKGRLMTTHEGNSGGVESGKINIYGSDSNQ